MIVVTINDLVGLGVLAAFILFVVFYTIRELAIRCIFAIKTRKNK